MRLDVWRAVGIPTTDLIFVTNEKFPSDDISRGRELSEGQVAYVPGLIGMHQEEQIPLTVLETRNAWDDRNLCFEDAAGFNDIDRRRINRSLDHLFDRERRDRLNEAVIRQSRVRGERRSDDDRIGALEKRAVVGNYERGGMQRRCIDSDSRSRSEYPGSHSRTTLQTVGHPLSPGKRFLHSQLAVSSALAASDRNALACTRICASPRPLGNFECHI